MSALRIKELSSQQEWQSAYPILKSLRADLIEKDFLKKREDFIRSGYTLFGLFSDTELVAVAGADLYPHLSRGIDCWVHDLATKEEQRSKGFGKELMRYIEKWAKEKGCSRLCVHTRVERTEAQKFYQNKLGYQQAALVYYQDLKL